MFYLDLHLKKVDTATVCGIQIAEHLRRLKSQTYAVLHNTVQTQIEPLNF